MSIEVTPLPSTRPAPASPRWLGQAPHRMMFFVGAANVLLAMLWSGYPSNWRLGPITVVILIQTIFLLSVFAEILVTTNGGPGNASTNLPYLVYQQSLLSFDVGGGSAGGIIAVILANIVAIFLMRMIGRTLET